MFREGHGHVKRRRQLDLKKKARKIRWVRFVSSGHALVAHPFCDQGEWPLVVGEASPVSGPQFTHLKNGLLWGCRFRGGR